MSNNHVKGQLHNDFVKKMLLCALLLMNMVSLALLAVNTVKFPIIPTKYVMVLYLVLIILLFVGVLLLKSKKIFLNVLGFISLVAPLVLSIAGNYYISNGYDAMGKIGSQTSETTTYGVYVMKTSDVKSVSDLLGSKVGISTKEETEKTNKVIEKIESDMDSSLKAEKFDDATALVKSLYSDDVEAIVLNKAYIDVVKEVPDYKNFKKETRLLKEYKVKTKIDSKNAKTIKPGEPFVMYISGMDTWGHISVASRSDVNIIAVVNPKTNQILLVSTPRDYYVPLSISNGSRDKLTHAGIYGIDVSMDTLSMLYGIDIDHYFKLNFSGFEGLIDAMDGITVWSDYDFEVKPIKHYKVGNNKLTGLEALAFARERHAFSGGDRQRGANQMNVIQSVVQKMCSRALLKNYTKILDKCDGTFATDMSSEEISAFVSYQLANGNSWDIQKFSVSGTGKTAPVYSLSQNVYVMEPNMDDVAKAKELIQEVLSGKKVDLSTPEGGQAD
jgi:LCP family protein required for cell wall assembly